MPTAAPAAGDFAGTAPSRSKGASQLAALMDVWRPTPGRPGTFTRYAKGKGGEYPTTTISGSAFQNMLQQNAKKLGVEGDELAEVLQPFNTEGFKFDLNERGEIRANISGSGGISRSGGAAGAGGTGGAAAGGSTATSAGSRARSGGNPFGGGGGGSSGGGSSSSVSSGGSHGRSQHDIPGAGGGGGGGGNLAEDTLDLGGGGGGGNGAGPPIDPKAPLGLDPSRGAPAGTRGGADRFRSGLFPGPGSILEGIGPGSSLNDVLMGTVRRQEASRDAALGIYGGLFEGFENDPTRQAVSGRANELLANPFSLDDQTIDRIRGKAAEGIGQNSERLQLLSRDRAASMGMGRSGLALANEDRIRMDAARQVGDIDRDLRIEQATRRPQELAAAIQTGSGVVGQQQGARADIGGRAADVLANQDISADALLAGVLSGGGPPPINIARGGRSGPISGVAYSGPSWMNPFG